MTGIWSNTLLNRNTWAWGWCSYLLGHDTSKWDIICIFFFSSFKGGKSLFVKQNLSWAITRTCFTLLLKINWFWFDLNKEEGTLSLCWGSPWFCVLKHMLPLLFFFFQGVFFKQMKSNELREGFPVIKLSSSLEHMSRTLSLIVHTTSCRPIMNKSLVYIWRRYR